MTEPAATSTELVVIHPATGEALDLVAMTTTDLAGALGELRELTDKLSAFRQAIIDEVAGRMDKGNARTEVVGPYKLVTNAPREESYPVRRLREELQPLIDAGELEPQVLDRLITTPRPKTPDPVVSKRELNKLKGSDNGAVLAALARVREVAPARRTLKVEPVEAGLKPETQGEES